ncbi:Phage portal protein [Microbacterium sp. 8M]|uniref:phage portal protein n=1 Tax=Microbacterium sp. 8M TaxID=2653153 RepID=UPI0012F105ED|nr:phage portal protein [Microbacterium sp. 8M]VXC30907.1 Phage portal protein [Microbacterium sp. 8M]
MVFAVSEGTLRAVQKPSYQAPSTLRLSDDLSMDYAELYRRQQSVRTVVDFLARNIAQLSLHTFERIDDSDRRRITDHPFAQLMRSPNPYTTGYRLIRDLIADRGIYDRALWVKTREKSGMALTRIPPRLWKIDDDDNWLSPSGFVIKGNRGSTKIPAESCVYFRGYNPEDERYGLSPIESLRRILSEEFAAGQMREQSLRNGARIGGYIQRPGDAPAWSDPARERFATGWRAQYTGQTATEGGGTPVLEDGMTFVAAGHSAADMQYIESRKLSREEAASAYFIPPPMVGILDNATFGNIEEQHKMLYQDTLGPILQEVQQEIYLQLIRAEFPDDADSLYVEFNMLEKLRGSFEEQASQLQTSVGAPFLTRNEARARLNLPRIDGADELVVPLNVLVGGLASPTDQVPAGSGGGSVPTEDEAKALIARLKTKARPSAAQSAKAAQVLAEFFARQERSVRSALGAKAAGWWDGARWDKELGGALLALSSSITLDVARKQLEQLGVDPDEYDVDRTMAWMRTVADANATSINAATEAALETALESDDDPDAVGHVFDVAKTARAQQGGQTLATTLAGFASVEAVQQVRGQRGATKTWVVTSGNPRASHAQMAGETVPIDSVFSNGAKWPGDSSALDVDEVAGCSCTVQINFE